MINERLSTLTEQLHKELGRNEQVGRFMNLMYGQEITQAEMNEFIKQELKDIGDNMDKIMQKAEKEKNG